MPDITMCTQDDCPVMGKCYRHEATPTPGRQSFAIFEPTGPDGCDSFLPIWNRDKWPIWRDTKVPSDDHS